MKLTHQDLLGLAYILGYESIGGKGLCQGFSVMLGQAFLIHKKDSFFSRLRLIESYKGKFPQLKKDIDGVREKIKQKQLINDIEKELLEIPSFFDGILLSQKPTNQRDIFAGNYVDQSNFEEIFPLISSIQLDKKNTPVSIVSNELYALDRKELAVYLTDLENNLKETDAVFPIFLASKGHTVLINYDRKKKKWFYVDLNLFELAQENYYFEADCALLTALLRISFDCAESSYLVFHSIAISTSDNENNNGFFDSLSSKHLDLSKQSIIYDSEGEGLLYQACKYGHVDLVKKLIRQPQIDINKATNKGTTPLHIACVGGYLDIVEELIQQPQIQINQKDKQGYTPLSFASCMGHTGVVKKLLQQTEIKINEAPKNGISPLHSACFWGYVDIVKELLQHPKIDIYQKSEDGFTALYITSQAPTQPQKLICLYLTIKQMELHGICLLAHDLPAGKVAQTLALKLWQKVDVFFSDSDPEKSLTAINEFITEFKTLLHSEDDLMKAHRAVWKPIIANILLALTGIGLVAIAVKSTRTILSSTSYTWRDCLFFPKTKREKQIERIEKSLAEFELIGSPDSSPARLD